ncbi:HAD family hydrolase [Sphingobacterium sp. Mn56C]|uniref:HAD family hydrolase n=1 Tax=Sphingobacterium sp. Mn56C TaxID=3395261 RepID=UPI003BE10CDC
MTSTENLKYLKLTELAKSYKALLFDVDGTLADNMAAHKASYVAVAQEYAIDLDPNLIDETAGWPTVAVAEEIARRYHKSFDLEVFSKRKSAIFIERFIQDTKPIRYVQQVLLDNYGLKKIAVVSGGSRSTLNITLAVIDVKDKYQSMVCAGDTPNGKPSAEPFLLAAQQLGVDPKDCLVFEDGDPGVQGAIAAGMGWVRIDKL